MTRVVTLTPLRVEADSRTYKQATSMTRLGFESVVIEGSPSRLDRHALPFELLTILPFGLRAADGGEGAPGGERPADLSSAATRARRVLWTSLQQVARILGRPVPLAVHVFGLCAYTAELVRRVPPAALYYLHSPYQFPAVYVLSRRHRAPIVYDAHDFYEDTARDPSRNSTQDRLLRKLDRAIERRCVSAAQEVVTVSEGVGRLFVQCFGRSAVIVRNAHDARLDTASVSDVRTAAGIPADDFVVVVVGNAKREMAIDECVAAIELLPPNVHIVFVGRNYGARRTANIQGERVHFLDAVSPTKVKSFISNADVAAVPYQALHRSLLNALPNGFFQAVAAGLPLIYPPLPEIRKLAEAHALGVCVDPANPQSIAAGVLALAQDPEFLADCRLGTERAARELTWEREEGTLKEVIATAIGMAPDH